MTVSRDLARWALDLAHRPLPTDIDRQVELHIADSLAITLAARRDALPAIRAPFGEDAGPLGAAFSQSALAHVLDFDDIHDAARLHPTTVNLPAAQAAAPLADASDEKVRSAVAIANEAICRLGLLYKPSGSGPGSDWFLTQLFGYFSAALASGLVLDLDEDALASALGLAYMQAAGAKEAGFGVGSNARSIYPAFAALGGLQAALLARGGVIGPETAFEGPAGLFRVYLGARPSEEGLASLRDTDAWDFRATEVKPWPCCRLSHPYVAASFALREALGGAPITRVVAHVNESAAKLCRPLDVRRVPKTLQDAKYSIPFMTAFALARGRVDLESLGSNAIGAPDVLALAARVEIVEDLPDGPGHPPAVVEAVAGGRTHTSPVGVPPVLDERGIQAKVAACLAFAGQSHGLP